MKKLLFVAILFAITCSSLKAQNDTVFYISQITDEDVFSICHDRYDRIILYAEEDCSSFRWWIDNYLSYDNPLVMDNATHHFVSYYGCNIDLDCAFYWYLYDTPTETIYKYWKRPFETLYLEAVGVDSLGTWYDEFNYSFLWSTGETTYNIDVAEPGTYTCEISSPCSSVTRTFIVRDNVEIYRSTVDLATNLNKVTWQVTDEQAGYINQVKVERDGFVVGTVPYQDGQFLDAIGSENAARNYRLTGILYDGTECPIPSYQKGTTHVDYSPNASNPNKLNMAWTPPYIEEGAPVSIAYFQICKYDSETNEITVIDQIGANNTIASYNNNLFEGGYAVLGVLFNESKDNEGVSFSNLSEEVLGVEENAENQFRVYPNPTNSTITVETQRATSLQSDETEYRITNAMGQTMLRGQIDCRDGACTVSTTTIDVSDLPQGVYFISIGSTTRKIVVE